MQETLDSLIIDTKIPSQNLESLEICCFQQDIADAQSC